jgi:hypothetical protein
LIEQIINELPTAHPSFLSTGTFNDLKSIGKLGNKNNKKIATNLNATMTTEALLASRTKSQPKTT